METKTYFENRFKEVPYSWVSFDGVVFNTISELDHESLTANFDPQEVKEAVWDCEGDKSPGPDSINFHFIKTFWNLLEKDVLRVVNEFYVHGVWTKGCNSSFIALIPKKDSPQGLNDFRPISLVGCIYKIVSKLLANRLKEVLPKVIGEEQSAFLSGRSMMDSIVTANELIHDARIRKKQLLIFKVDFEKSYYSVRWDFLVYVMRRMHFNERWIKWIEGCLKSARVSVLVNRSPSEEFGMGRGLRQGDPLAPFLFLIVAEGINCLFHQAVRLEKFVGYGLGRENEVRASILQFADDTFFLVGLRCKMP